MQPGESQWHSVDIGFVVDREKIIPCSVTRKREVSERAFVTEFEEPIELMTIDLE